jgi:outer membrane protein, adhesin transport system
MPFLRIAAVLLLVAAVENQAQAGWFSINDAISQAVLTNPAVGEASANRRATEAELRQTQGTLLPQVRLESRLGPEKFDQQIIPPPIGNNKWLPGRSASVVVRQIRRGEVDQAWLCCDRDFSRLRTRGLAPARP